MTTKTRKKSSGKKMPNLESEAALQYCLDNWKRLEMFYFQRGRPGRIEVYGESSEKPWAVIDLRKLIKRRAPLTGITKRLKSAVRPKKK